MPDLEYPTTERHLVTVMGSCFTFELSSAKPAASAPILLLKISLGFASLG